MLVTPEPHSIRYLALLYSLVPQRSVLEALFGIEREVSDSLRPGIDHHVAHSRLQWWREECERTAAGRPVHPLARALVAALSGPQSTATSHIPPAATPLPQLAGLSGFVDVAVWDLAGATFETRRELTAYCERWSAAIIGPLVSGSNPDPLEGTADWPRLGAALREIELLADLAREAHYGRLRIPLDELEGVKAEPTALAKPPWPDAIVKLLRARHDLLRGEIARAISSLDRERQAALRGLVVWAALAWRLSRRVERALPNRLSPGRFDAIADAWFAWRVARRATMGQFRLN